MVGEFAIEEVVALDSGGAEDKADGDGVAGAGVGQRVMLLGIAVMMPGFLLT